MLARRVCRRGPLPRRVEEICGRGPELASGKESTPTAFFEKTCHFQFIQGRRSLMVAPTRLHCFRTSASRKTHRPESLEGERASAGRGCFERGTLNANRKANRSGASLFKIHMPPLRLQGQCSGKMDESGGSPQRSSVREHQGEYRCGQVAHRFAQALAFVIVRRI